MPAQDEPRPHSLGLEPSPDESLQSYVFRLARRRRTEPPHALAIRLGWARLATRVRRDVVERLAREAQVPLKSLLPLWRGDPDNSHVLFWNRRLPVSALDWRSGAGRKVCPECLAEFGRHLAVWDLSFVSACPIHRAALVDTCLACKLPLSWKGDDVAWCGCAAGGDLRRIRAAPVTLEQAHATACVQGMLGDPRFASEGAEALARPPFQNMTPGRAVEFLVRLGLDAVATRPRRQPFAFERLGDYDVPPHESLARALAAVGNWPTGFPAVLDHLRRHHVTDVGEATRRVTTPVVRWVTHVSGGGGKEIRRAVAEYRRATRALPGYVSWHDKRKARAAAIRSDGEE
ncbi:TniQ family protein [Pseudoroseomonas ludipueritiae]|uniref:TniQ family protein n=1 Tax=Pseudoroseomonas ludipueritiae TaxID=198093 RepID=A0ABR7R3I4_9PROT|nr:TniQ family protein [Pseudoroseomonas ludipueritiae]MBC9176207.1 TniQ family protein [Pseudoroseomonas ludipueritiae]